MENFLPVTERFMRDVFACPFKAYQHHVNGMASAASVKDWLQDRCRALVAKVRSGECDLPGALAQIGSEPDDELYREELTQVVTLADERDPVECMSDTERASQLIGVEFFLDAEGKLVPGPSGAIVKGHIDRVYKQYGDEDDVPVMVEVLKIGTSDWTASTTERYISILGACALFPDWQTFRFNYFFPQLDREPHWWADFSDERRTVREVDATYTEQVHRFKENPLLIYVKEEIKQVEKLSPMPLPGPHCRSWYGEPCQFLEKECSGTSKTQVDSALVIGEIIRRDVPVEEIIGTLAGVSTITEASLREGLKGNPGLRDFLLSMAVSPVTTTDQEVVANG